MTVSASVRHLQAGAGSSPRRVVARRAVGVLGGKTLVTRRYYELPYLCVLDPTNGESSVTGTALFPSGRYSFLSDEPVWAGHRFVGWFTTSASPSAAVPSMAGAVSPIDSIDYSVAALFARWQLPCTVTFDATTNGGTMPSGWSSPYYYAGQPFGTLPVPTHPTLPFAGWVADGSIYTTDDPVPAGGVTLVARYGYPYDALVEYIQSSGTQYIDTGIIPDQTTVVKLKIYNLQTTGLVLLGYYDGDDSKDWRLFNNASNVYMDVWNRRAVKGSSFGANVWRELEVGNCYVNDLAADKSLVSTTAAGTFTGMNSIYLNGNISPSKNRWGYVQIYKGGVLVSDLVPVRVGTEGRMYDRVSERLLPVSGSGTFSCGSDLA